MEPHSKRWAKRLLREVGLPARVRNLKQPRLRANRGRRSAPRRRSGDVDQARKPLRRAIAPLAAKSQAGLAQGPGLRPSVPGPRRRAALQASPRRPLRPPFRPLPGRAGSLGPVPPRAPVATARASGIRDVIALSRALRKHRSSGKPESLARRRCGQEVIEENSVEGTENDRDAHRARLPLMKSDRTLKRDYGVLL